jgi:HEAT repeat protein
MMKKELTWFLTLTLVVGGRSGAARPGDDVALALADALRRAEARAGSVDAAGRELAGLGVGIVPIVLRALDAGRLPGATEELDPTRVDFLLGALAHLEHGTVVGQLETQLDAGELRAVTALKVLGAVGSAQDLELLIGLADDGGASELEAAAARILERDDGAWPLVQRKVIESSPVVASSLLCAVSSLSSPRGLLLLDDLLGLLPPQDVAILSHIGKLGGKIPWEAGELSRVKVREYLRSLDMQLVRSAAMALGELEDSAATLDLVELLDSDSASVRSAAHWALQQVTGLQLPADTRRWSSWYATESCWFEKYGARLLDRLDRADPQQALHALDELSAHRYKRDVIAYRIAPLLGHQDAGLRQNACRALGRLESRVSVPALRAALNDRELAVIEEAARALRAITGEDRDASLELARR